MHIHSAGLEELGYFQRRGGLSRAGGTGNKNDRPCFPVEIYLFGSSFELRGIILFGQLDEFISVVFKASVDVGSFNKVQEDHSVYIVYLLCI